MRQEVYLVTKDRLRQIESLVCELEEERERFAREARRPPPWGAAAAAMACCPGSATGAPPCFPPSYR